MRAVRNGVVSQAAITALPFLIFGDAFQKLQAAKLRP
jgi:hypothetical protein